MKRILKYYLKPHYIRMLIGFTIKFIGTIMDLLLPWILAKMIDEIIPQDSIRLIIVWGIAMIFCSIVAMTFNIAANRMAARVARDTTGEIRGDLFHKVMYLSNKEIDSITKPSIISRLTSDTYHVHQMIGMTQRLGVRTPILLVGGIIVTLSLDRHLAYILLAVMPLIGILLYYITKKSIPMYDKLQRVTDRFVRVVREDISGIRVIKALSKTKYEEGRFAKTNEEVVNQEKKAGILMAFINPAMNVLLNIGLVLVIILGAYRVNKGLSQVGVILAFMTYFTLILNAMMSIARIFTVASKGIASANRIMEIIETEEENVIALSISKEENVRKKAYIEFNHVSFAYEEENVLTDISFTLEKGETLGIIGATGAGKTTIVNLIMRMYEITKGNIYIDGIDIREMDLKQLRQKFGAVFQNDTIFEASITENIRLGRELTKQEIEKGAKYAKASEFIEKEKGYEGHVNIKGGNLSGGQKQRIMIARALAGKPEILILDDSSSALDYKTDAALRREIKEHFKGTTTIIVAQRISSIKHADKIVVLEAGKVIGYGTHDDLMNTCSIYQEISLSQMGI